MRKHIAIIVMFASLLLTGCKGHGVKDIEVTSFKIVSIVPKGVSGITALVEVGIHNPMVGFEVTDVHATAKVKDAEALVLTADQLMVPGHTDKVYSIPVKGSIVEGFNPLQLLKIFSNDLNMSDVTVTVKAKVALRGGVGKNIEIKDIPISNFVSKE